MGANREEVKGCGLSGNLVRQTGIQQDWLQPSDFFIEKNNKKDFVSLSFSTQVYRSIVGKTQSLPVCSTLRN